MSGPPIPTVGANAEVLFGLVGSLRAELRRRGEPLAADWVDQAVEELRSGELVGFYFPPTDPPAGLGFFSPAGRRAYGHVHLESGPGAAERARMLIRALVERLPAAVERGDFGLSGLPAPDEQAMIGELTAGSSEVVVRLGLERAIGPADGQELRSPPNGTVHVRADEVPLESLVELDRRAFAGTPDASLIAETPEEHRRVLREVFGGRLGRFLAAASTVLLDESGRAVAAVLSAEETPRRAILHDLVVAPWLTRRGVGGYLLSWTFGSLHALGYTSVGLWVTETNVAARRLYENVGFVSRGTATIYRWNRSAGYSEEPQPHTSR